jgi:hypothetical protein
MAARRRKYRRTVRCFEKNRIKVYSQGKSGALRRGRYKFICSDSMNDQASFAESVASAAREQTASAEVLARSLPRTASLNANGTNLLLYTDTRLSRHKAGGAGGNEKRNTESKHQHADAGCILTIKWDYQGQ